MARAVLVVPAAALLALPVLLPSEPLAMRGIASVLAPLAAVVLAAAAFRRQITGWLARELLSVSGPAMLKELPPRVVLSSLLDRIFRDRRGHESVLAGILGGAGLDVHGRDIATSRRTDVHVCLRSIDAKSYECEITLRHQLSGSLANHDFVVFATYDPKLWNLLARERKHPLYESWFVPDERELHAFGGTLRRTLKIGISYRDDAGTLHEVEPGSPPCTEPLSSEYSDYVQLPGDVEIGAVKIYCIELGQLADPDHVMGEIETITVQATSFERAEYGIMTWSPPYPCFVDRVTFDVEKLRLDDHELLFRLTPFTMERPGPSFSYGWSPARCVPDLVLQSWLLAGHGFALNWRPTSPEDEETILGP